MSWLLGAIMGGAASSAWEFGDEVESKLQRRGWWWKQFKAKRRADDGAAMGHVSAFRAAVTEDAGEKATLARHALAKTKMLRHPNILSCVDVVESEKDVVIVTEAVVALPDWLLQQRAAGTSQEQLDAVVVWGVRCILDALCFLHSQGLVHGLLCPESIFVTKAGDFKLWGLDLASNLTIAADQAYFRKHERCLATLSGGPQFRSPERSEGEWEKHDKHFGAVDGWSLGHTIPAMFIDEPTAELGKVCKRLSVSNPLARPKLGRVLEADCFTSHPYTVAMLFVVELSLKDHSELVAFFKALVQALPTMPTATRVYKLLPALHSGITRSLAPDKRPDECREMVAACLPILGEIGSSMSGEEYREHVLPAVLPLFGVKDRAVRMLLLDRVEALVKHMDAQTVNGLVFEQLNAGFSDTAKELRELTLKSMLSLVDKLNDVNMNDKLMRTLAKLQQDSEASIRTNTTIFYGKVRAQT
jgi:SCY1-like protein 1